MKDYKSVVSVGIVLILLIIFAVGCTEEIFDELVKEIGEVISDQIDETIEDIKKDVEEKKDELIDNIRPGSIKGKAIEWAKDREGDRNTYLTDEGWGLCHQFVLDAFAIGGDINVDKYRGLGGAVGVYNKFGANKCEPPPPGTMVLYQGVGTENRGDPHTALALEKGKIIHNNTYERYKSRVEIINYDDPIYNFGTKYKYEYLGWIDVVNN